MPDARRLRASINVRLSVRADEDNLSLSGMRGDCRALAERMGFDVVDEHVDEGQSGGKRGRTGFQAWLADAREGRADVLIAWHVDRLTREGLNVAAQILDVVEGKDPTTGRSAHPPVRLLDCHGLDSNDGESFRFRFVIMAEVARAERERMRARQRDRNERMRQAGRWPGGPPPFGYRIARNPNGAGYVLDLAPAEAAALRRAADRLLSGGETLGAVVRKLNAEGPPPRRAKEWRRSTLMQSLTGDHLLGRITHKGRVLRDDTGAARTPYPAVLTVAQLAGLRQVLAQVPDPTGRKGSKGRTPTRSLGGLLACHSCGYLLTPAPRVDGTISYRCQRRSEGGLCEAPVVVSAPAIEAWAEDLYLRSFGRLPATRVETLHPADEDLATIDEDIAAALADLATQATAEGFDRLRDLQARRAERAAVAPAGPITRRVLTGRTCGEEWDSLDAEGRRDVLASALPPLVVGPGRRGRRGFDPSRLVGFDLDAIVSAEDAA